MRKKLALLLVLALVISLVPMSAFAASSNTVDKVPKVADDMAFTAGDAPKLRIEEKTVGDFKTKDTFRLTLEGAGAEWNYADGDTVTGCIHQGTATAGDVMITKITDTIIDVELDGLDTDRTIEARIDFPMDVTIDGTGEAKVVVDPRDTTISSGTYTYAIAAGGATVATVGSSKTIQRGNKEEGASIVIDEANIGALEKGTQKFRVKLPKDFEWSNSMDTGQVVATGNIDVESVTGQGTRNLDIELDVTDQDASRRTITIKPLISVTRDAKYGDVEIDIDGRSSDVTSEYGLLIAEYKDYGVSVTIDEVEEVFSGKLDYDDVFYTAEIKIKENIKGSLLSGRVMEFALPSWVKIVKDEEIKITNKGGKELKVANIKVDKYGSEFDIDIPTEDKTDKTEWKIELPLTVKANGSGEVEMTVKGAGVEKTNLVIAEAVAPIEAEISVADVRIGIQSQEAPDILITETKKGALKEDADLEIWFKDTFGFRFDDAEYEVIEGDLEIDEDNADISRDGQSIIIPIDSESTKASTIKISGIELTLDRTVPEGPFKVRVGGDALVDNMITKNSDDDELDPKDYYTKDFVNRVVEADFANVVTRAGGVEASTAIFVIGDNTYRVIEGNKEIEKVMDVTPFIEDGRTFLPIRYVAEALGVHEDNVMWNAQARTVTILKGDRVVGLTIGSSTLTVNGTPIQMDTVAKIKDGRTVLPIRYVAQALGAQIDWDPDARIVTVNQ